MNKEVFYKLKILCCETALNFIPELPDSFSRFVFTFAYSLTVFLDSSFFFADSFNCFFSILSFCNCSRRFLQKYSSSMTSPRFAIDPPALRIEPIRRIWFTKETFPTLNISQNSSNWKFKSMSEISQGQLRLLSTDQLKNFNKEIRLKIRLMRNSLVKV